MIMSARRVVFLGPPGVGKGTQAKRLSLEWKVPVIVTGDLFREAMAREDALGQKVAGYVRQGELVPDEVVVEVIRERLKREDVREGFILDGFPRTIGQAQALEDLLDKEGTPLDAAVCFVAPKEVIVERIGGRLVCPNCGQVYHKVSNPPIQEGLCDVCHSRLYVREDDQPEAIARRLEVYEESTKPLRDYYRKRSLLREVEATGDVETVYDRLKEALRDSS